ncbi:uncharacterized protein METZ01_LOCUS278030, partial [marine metagenome]
PDHTDPSGRFGMVDVKPLLPVTNLVTLSQIKAEPKLADLSLVRQSRLSVMPVSATHWKILCKMAGIKMGHLVPGLSRITKLVDKTQKHLETRTTALKARGYSSLYSGPHILLSG